MALTKSDIADHIWNNTDLSLKESIHATECLLEIIKSTLESGDEVRLSGFGKLCQVLVVSIFMG